MKAYVGTSGYQYKAWNHDFYPDHVRQKDWLKYYATQFNSVEINASFYRLPAASTFAKWRDEVGSDFVFVIKGSRYVTHQLRLREPEEPIERLFSRTTELGDKLGAVLWQFVERWPCNDERLARLDHFCQCLSRHTLAGKVPQAFELRNKSWFNDQLYGILRKHNYALVVNQSSKWPIVEIATANWSYFRFHGPRELYSSGYSEEQLTDWARRAKKLTTSQLFAYFNNDNGNYAPWNAQDFRNRLE
jgi:uncharacterized protein YecE (DUF72 family)